jgi:hypothetical protein
MNRTHNPLIAMNRNERSVYSVFSDRIEAYSVIELTEIHVHNLTVKQEPLPGEKNLVKKQAPQVAKTLIEQYGGIWSHSMPVMDVGRSRSGGLSKVFHKIAAGW